MSTILDALRKVERERDPAAEPTLDGPTISPDVRRRRPFPFAAVAICALVGFGGGALLSWLTSQPTVDVAALPVPPPAPEIVVPRAPVGVERPLDAPAPPAGAPQPPAVSAEAAKPESQEVEVASAPRAVAAPVAPPLAAGAPSEGGPSATRDVVPREQAAPAVSRPAKPALAAADNGSALEPSPFGPVRDARREPTAPAIPPPAAAPIAVPDRDLAALTPPMPPTEPRIEEAPEPAPESEPATPGETLFDTGRSPPGAPKVALSFLQWSADPARRFAFISIDGAPTQRVHEGEVTAGLTVAAITPTGVQFKREGTIFVIRPRH
jgi:hypothetical protein